VPTSQAVAELAEQIERLVERADTVVSIRSDDGRFVHVNSAWERYFGRAAADVLGKSLAELNIMTPVEVALSDAVDEVVRIQKSIVETSTYALFGVPTRFVVIRSLLRYRAVNFRVVISFSSAQVMVATAMGWDPLRVDRVYAELVAVRLRLLESSSQFDGR
jgi:PAS domain-containing protein